MKRYLLVALLCLNSCTDSPASLEQSDPIDEVEWTKEERITRLYQETVIPLFEDFEGLNIPSELQIDERDLDINAGAAHGYVEISRGLVNLENEVIQLFALTHEVSHIATLAQAQIFGLQGAIPQGPTTNVYKKAEYLADLMALHLLGKERPADFNPENTDFEMLQEILSSERFTHPSGKERIDALKTYLQEVSEGEADTVFRSRFETIWNMD